MRATTFGVIIGNRGFFPAVLARDGREEILRILEQEGYKTVCPTPEDTKFGSVETLQDARKCGELFRKHGFMPMLKESAGGHAWANWREYLNEFAPQLFQQEREPGTAHGR